MQPHPLSVRNALAKDSLLTQFRDGSRNELTWQPDVLETDSRQPLLADFCIAAANYTAQTLIENGVESKPRCGHSVWGRFAVFHSDRRRTA